MNILQNKIIKALIIAVLCITTHKSAFSNNEEVQEKRNKKSSPEDEIKENREERIKELTEIISTIKKRSPQEMKEKIDQIILQVKGRKLMMIDRPWEKQKATQEEKLEELAEIIEKIKKTYPQDVSIIEQIINDVEENNDTIEQIINDVEENNDSENRWTNKIFTKRNAKITAAAVGTGIAAYLAYTKGYPALKSLLGKKTPAPNTPMIGWNESPEPEEPSNIIANIYHNTVNTIQNTYEKATNWWYGEKSNMLPDRSGETSNNVSTGLLSRAYCYAQSWKPSLFQKNSWWPKNPWKESLLAEPSKQCKKIHILHKMKQAVTEDNVKTIAKNITDINAKTESQSGTLIDTYNTIKKKMYEASKNISQLTPKQLNNNIQEQISREKKLIENMKERNKIAKEALKEIRMRLLGL